MRRPCTFALLRPASRFAGVAAVASLIAGCASAVRLDGPVYTGSTSNQQQIITSRVEQGSRLQSAPVAATSYNGVESRPLPPPGQAPNATRPATAYAPAASSAPAGYTPPKPYAARGLPKPVGALNRPAPLPTRNGHSAGASAPQTDSRIVAERAPKSLGQQAARLEGNRRSIAQAGGAYTVRPGDTVWGISNRHNVTAEELLAANNLRGNQIRIGQRLRIPGAGETAQTPVRVAGVDPKIAATDPRAGLQRIEGDTLAYVPNPRPQANGGRISVATRTPARPSSVDVSRTDAGSPKGYVPPKAAASTPQVPSKKAAEAPGSGFRWPVRGKVISSFGKKPNGERNDGINLAVPEGTSVKAAEEGVVIYSGNELKSYGNLILIKHADGWVSAYAHNSRLLVGRGDKIRRGQIIAESGMTGGVTSPQLHFELRKGATPVNPLEHMAGA